MGGDREAAVAAWRDLGNGILRPLGYKRRGLVWQLSDGRLDRLLLMESLLGAFALRAHYVHPSLADTSVRRPGSSVFVYPAHLVNENHIFGHDPALMVGTMRRHAEAGVNFLARWSTPAEVVRKHLLLDEMPDGQSVMPLPRNPRAYATAVAWATASGDTTLRNQAVEVLTAVPPSRYKNEVSRDLDFVLARLPNDQG